MARQKSGTFDNKEYQNSYHKAMKTKLLSFNQANPEDVEMWEYITGKSNATGYIKQLIREDMKRQART